MNEAVSESLAQIVSADYAAEIGAEILDEGPNGELLVQGLKRAAATLNSVRALTQPHKYFGQDYEGFLPDTLLHSGSTSPGYRRGYAHQINSEGTRPLLTESLITSGITQDGEWHEPETAYSLRVLKAFGALKPDQTVRRLWLDDELRVWHHSEKIPGLCLKLVGTNLDKFGVVVGMTQEFITAG